MAPSAIVALCLLAVAASAAPQNLQDLQCATSCDPTKQDNVDLVGITVRYNYNIASSVKLAGVNEGVTQGGLTAVVDLTRINLCEWSIKVTSSDETAKVNKYPMVVALNENYKQIGKFCTHPEDDSESINIKKGIASAFQQSIPENTLTKKIILLEKSVLGTCPTAYSVENSGQNKVVTKEIVHSECQNHGFSQSEIPSLLSKSPMPLQVSKSVCTKVFSSNIGPQKITCKDTKVVRPSYGTYKYIEATQVSTLEFVSSSNDLSVLSSIKGIQLLNTQFKYDHSMPTKKPKLVGKLDTVLKEACEKIQGQGHPDSASVVNKAIELLKHIPEDAFITVLGKIRAGDYCTDYSMLEAVYLDAVAFIGEPGALKVIAQEVSAGRVTGGRTALYTAALHLLSKPTAKHVAALTPIATIEDPSSTLILAAATVVNKHCKLTTDCEKSPAVNNIVKLLTDKLVNQCTPSFSNSKPLTVLTTLKTLGNIGYLATEHAEKVIKCAKTEGVETNVRFAATLTLKGTPCKAPVKSALKAIVLNKDMDTEVRIGSYLAVIKCADEGDLQELLSKITTDSNKQVQSFVFSHLNNLKETGWPMKTHLQKLLNKINIPSTYGSNIFKYSRNIEISYNTPILGVGAAVDSNVVYTPESYIPRLVNLGLDMNLLGSFVNIGEVGARVEGLDPMMKEAFGPESYLYTTPLSEMFKDTSLFIKQNGANIFNKLEKLIKNGESVDINSLIQTVSAFLKANNIKLPKTDLYAKLMGQEYDFLSLAGPMQEVNINNVVETITAAIVDALVAAKDLNVNTARAAHLHFDYAIPTIQGIPLKVKLMTTAVTGIEVQSKLNTNANAHDAILKIIPSLSIAIDGHIGYGNTMKHGLKMKNTIYSTNGLAIYASLKNGQDMELKLELPEKMELINVKSELYQVTVSKLMDEEKIYPSNIKDTRIVKEQCSAIAEPLTGLHLCFKMDIPDVLNSNSLPLGAATQVNIYLQKSDAAMKGYRVLATLKNKADKKVLKMVAGTYGSASSTETSVKLSYTKEANTYLTAAEIKTVWFTSGAKASLIYQGDLLSLKILANHQFSTGAPKAVACKFDVKQEAIENGNEFLVTGFAGLAETLTDTHKFLNIKMLHARHGDLTNADLFVNLQSSYIPLTVTFGLDIPTKTPWFTVIRKVELMTTVGITTVEALVLRKMPGQYQNSLTVLHGGASLILLEATHTVTGTVFTAFNLITDASAKLGNREIGTTFSFKHENAVVNAIWELKNAGAGIFNISIKHSMESKLYTTTMEIALPTLPKTLKFSNVINVVEFLSYKIMTDLHMDNTALVHIEGPVALQLSKTMINHNVDLKITGAFDGTLKVLSAALLSFEKIQYTFDMRNTATPIAIIDVILDLTNTAETTFKAVINAPVLVKAEYAAVINSDLLHTTMNTFILPTTSLARRFKGYAEFDLKGLKLKTDVYWDAEKDTTKKLALNTWLKTDNSIGKVFVQGDLTVTTLTYGFKLEAVMASPYEWFLGTSGLELTVTAPSNKAIVAKALWTVEYSESLVILKPLMAVHTLDANKYEIAGSLAIKKFPAVLNFDIISDITINAPQIQKITVATKILHEDKNGACAFVFKSGITGLTAPISFEITHGFSGNKYITLYKVQHGSTVGSIATNVALISGFKAFDITVDASLPFAAVKALSMRATKTAEGALTFTLSKNQMVLAKLHYVMTSWTAHTLGLECPSRTIEFFVGFTGNEMTMKVFPEKNLSSKMIKTIIRLTNKAGSANIECFITAPSLANEIRIATEFSLADPTMDNIINVNIQFPTTEFKTLVTVMLEEVKKIYEDLVKDGVFPDLYVVYNELNLVINKLPQFLNTLKLQIVDIITRYWNIVRNWAMTMWKNYESEVTVFVKTAITEVLRYWEIVKIEVPILYNDLLTIIKKSEMWKILNGFVNQIIERYPAQFNILFDFYTKVILTTVTEVKGLVKKMINLPSFRFEAVWELLQIELPTIFDSLREQLLNSQLLTVIVEKINNIKLQYPAVYNAMVDIWASFIKPVYADLVTFLRKLMNMNFKDMTQVIDNVLKEVVVFFNNAITRLVDTEVMRLFVTKVKDFIAANPIIISVYEAVVEVLHNTMMALLGDLAMFHEKLMTIPMIRKVVEWVQHIINTKNINMEFLMKSAAATVHNFVTEVLGVTYTIAGDHFSAVITLPVSVTTCRHIWTTVTAYLPAFVDEVINSLAAFVEKIPVYFTTVKDQVGLFVRFAAEQIPVIVKAVEIHVPKFIHDFVPVINNFIEFLRNTEVAKFLMAKINEVIKIYPAQFNLVKENVEKFIKLAVEYTTLFYNKMMEIPIIRRIVEYIWNLIYHKDIKTSMVSLWNSLSSSVSSYSLSSWNSVSSSLSSYSSAVSSNLPSFIKLHTPSMVKSWMPSLIQ